MYVSLKGFIFDESEKESVILPIPKSKSFLFQSLTRRDVSSQQIVQCAMN